MGQIAEVLKKSREQQGVTLREAEKETKIRISYLQALENEEFDKLPGRVYALGFLRNYAGFLGLEAAPLVEELKAALPQAEEQPLETQLTYSPHARRFSWLPIILIVLALTAAAYFIYTYTDREVEDTTELPGETETRQEQLPENDVQPSPPAGEAVGDQNVEEVSYQGLELVLKIEEQQGARSWLDIREDGKSAFTGELKAGERIQFNAERQIYVKLGNAGAVNLVLNGKQLEKLGGYGDVQDMTFTLEDVGQWEEKQSSDLD